MFAIHQGQRNSYVATQYPLSFFEVSSLFSRGEGSLSETSDFCPVSGRDESPGVQTPGIPTSSVTRSRRVGSRGLFLTHEIVGSEVYYLSQNSTLPSFCLAPLPITKVPVSLIVLCL